MNLKITQKTLLKAIEILRKEPEYYHRDYENPKGNCFCGLGAIAKAATRERRILDHLVDDMTTHDGKIVPGKEVRILLSKYISYGSIASENLGKLRDPSEGVTREDAMTYVASFIPWVPK